MEKTEECPFQNTVEVTEEHLQTQNLDLICPLSLHKRSEFSH